MGHAGQRYTVSGQCRGCKSAQHARHYEKHRAQVLKKANEHYKQTAQKLSRDKGRCAKCGGDKTPEKNAPTHWRCLSCTKERRKTYYGKIGKQYFRQWRVENSARIKGLVREWRMRNPEAARAIDRRKDAKRKGAPGTHSAADVRRILELQRGCCAICKTEVRDKYHVDHVFPIKLGGTNDAMNLQILCVACNCHKSAKHPTAFMQERGYLI